MRQGLERQVDEHCLWFSDLIRQVHGSALGQPPAPLRLGTPNDIGWLMALWDEDQIYGKISVVRLGNQCVAVLAPVITDAREWALINVKVKLDMVFSTGRFDAESGGMA